MLESDWSIRKVFISLYALDSLDGWMNGGLYGYSWLIKNTVGGWGSRETKLQQHNPNAFPGKDPESIIFLEASFETTLPGEP